MSEAKIYGLDSMEAAEKVAEMLGLKVERGSDLKPSKVNGGGHMIPPNSTPQRVLEHLANITGCTKVC
jgi:hypothetical protein